MKTNKFSNERVRGERIIYTASSFAMQNLIYLQEIGKSEYLEPYISKRGVLSSFLFFIVENGTGRLTFHDVTYELEKGSCVFVNCNDKYAISSSQDLWSLDWIHFNGSTMKLIYDKFVERCGGPCFSSKEPEKIIAQHGKILEVARDFNYIQDMEIMTEISSLLSLIMEQCWRNTTECETSTSEKKWIPVKVFLDENYFQNIKLDELSARFAINKFYLTRKFKEEYGFTINQYVNNLRITNAKELLRFTDMAITEIAIEVGFNDSAYFTRIFKKEVGVSPMLFKKQWQGKEK